MTGEEANLGRSLLNVMLESWSGEWLFLPFFNVVFACVLETDNISKI